MKKNEPRMIGGLIAILLLAGPISADEIHRKLSREFAAERGSMRRLQVIVQWTIPTGTETQAKIQNLGGTIIHEFTVIKGGTYSIPAKALDDLEQDPNVSYVSIDRKIRHKLDYSAAAVNSGAAINAGWSGSGVGVAVIDSGINPDPNLSNIVASFDFTGSSGKAYGRDQYGHGQHVAGIIASTSASTAGSNYSRNFVGISPGANLIDLRALDANGQGSDTNVISAIEWAIYLKNAYNIRVINLSLGRPVYESYKQDPLCQAVEAAWNAGIVVVVAAGNDGRDNTQNTGGYGTITAPGNDPYVITVGAMKAQSTYSRTDDTIATYSSKGPTQVDHVVKPDIVAPGNRVVSLMVKNSTLASQNPGNTVQVSYYQNTNSGKTSQQFFTLSGTSMAAPVVSGAAADLLQLNPALTPDQIKSLLMRTAYKTFPLSSTVTDPTTNQTFTSYYDIFTVGAGYLDIGAAVAAVTGVPASGNSLSPTAAYDPTSGSVTIAVDPNSVFTNQAVWGAQAVWGTQAVWGAQAIWGTQAIWGASVINNSNQAVWGTQAVWGATTPSAQNTVWGSNAIWGSSATSSSESDTTNINGEQ